MRGTCFVAFEPGKDTASGYLDESQMTVHVNGKITRLYRVGPRWPSLGKEHTFESKDKRLKVSYLYRVVSDSCVEGEDKCCGQEFEGLLTLQTPSGKEQYKFQFYRGG